MDKVAIIECDDELLVDIVAIIQRAFVGKPIFYSDHMECLVKRHCPEVFSIADEAGFMFVPSTDKDELAETPPDFRFDIVRKTETKDLN